jgi:hypothetical protein
MEAVRQVLDSEDMRVSEEEVERDRVKAHGQ